MAPYGVSFLNYESVPISLNRCESTRPSVFVPERVERALCVSKHSIVRDGQSVLSTRQHPPSDFLEVCVSGGVAAL